MKRHSPGASMDSDFYHIVPFAAGGMTVESNLQTLCRECNRSKGSKC